MKNSVPKCLKKLAAKLDTPLYIVGGAVRNYLAGLYLSDIDICAAKTPEELCKAATDVGFLVRAVYPATYTVNIQHGDYSFEFSSLRTERYERGHMPSKVALTDDLSKDALRRDFKCNAVYYDVGADKLIDTVGGIDDINNKVLSAVTDPMTVFKDDGLRIMRLARFSGELDFTPEQDTVLAAQKFAENLKDIKPERIFTELKAILLADKPNGIKNGHYTALKTLEKCGALRVILPELADGENIMQRQDFHKYDVLEHSLRAAKYAEGSVRLAALLHDVGKPYCYNLKGNFYGHDKIGAEIAANILKRLKAPKLLMQTIRRMILLHMYDFDLSVKTAKIKRFIVKNYDIYRSLLKLRQADYSASYDDLSEAPGIIKWEKIRTEMINSNVPLTLSDLKIDGRDATAAGFSGRQIKEVLDEIFWLCVEDPDKNERDSLLSRLEKIKNERYTVHDLPES